MKGLIRSLSSHRSVALPAAAMLVFVFVLGGAVLASNMGFKLNLGILNAMNSLFRPHGYDTEGTWTGEGSGVSFSLSMPESESETALLNLRTPPGTISLPYWYEIRRPSRGGRMQNGSPPVVGNPGMRYSGTNFNFDPREPLTFASSDGVAEVSIFSKPEGNPMVRYSGTGNIMRNDDGQVEVESFIGTDKVWIRIGGEDYTWQRLDGVWTLVSEP